MKPYDCSPSITDSGTGSRHHPGDCYRYPGAARAGSGVGLMRNGDPIRAAIKAHARAFASRANPSQDWKGIDSSAEALLEVMPSSVEGVIAVASHCVAAGSRRSPRLPDQESA